ncbi:MAG: FkbM family methyltransferase [Oculatellaceae cyanobacterium Prado106]|nr:FkbM family methyltransferase [Oculatellaceae cyanobacterium Prado106]
MGSRKLGASDDYASGAWGLFAPHLTIYGFDADADACDEANADLANRQVNWTEKHIPLALSKSVGEATLYVTQNPMCSSLYPPNQPYLDRFANLSELVSLDFTVDMETTTLDEFCKQEGISSIDFLQVDVQGADLQVLQGSEQILNTVLAVQTEVEFSHLYQNQPLFADTDAYLRTKDFTLFHMTSMYVPRARSPIVSSQRSGQLLWGDAFYFCDLLHNAEMLHHKTPEQILKLACIADILDFPDYTLELLEFLTVNYGSDPNYNFANNIVEGLSQFPFLIEDGLESLPVIQNIQTYLTNVDLKSVQPAPSLQVSFEPMDVFHSEHYQQHNQRRLEHLASLRLDLAGKTVLEVGAGIGDHTHFFIDRGCKVTTTEGRPENLKLLQTRYPDLSVAFLDMDQPEADSDMMFEIVYCYGLLYHLKNPVEAIAFMAQHCSDMLLLETCVSYGDGEAMHPCNEWSDSPSQAISGWGCRPTRKWVYNQLKKHFNFVYLPVTQPNHEQFPIDWSIDPQNDLFSRSVFIASRKAIQNSILVEEVLMKQQKH